MTGRCCFVSERDGGHRLETARVVPHHKFYEGIVVIDMRWDALQLAGESKLGSELVVDRLSRAYAERVERINEMRERLDQICEILLPYLDEPQAVDLDVDDLKRVLDLTEYNETARSRR